MIEALYGLFDVITPWHWLGLALLLLAVEMLLGTYDLLWISAAAFLTALYAALPLGDLFSGWQAEAIFFALSSLVLLVLGRTVFSGLRGSISDRPLLNQRGKSLVGRTAIAVTDFTGGEGRVKLGDSTWLALADKDLDISAGTEVEIKDVDGTVLKVAV